MIRFTKYDELYGCFSNFYMCNVTYDGVTYTNSEAAWQAQKVENEDDRREFANLNPSKAKSLGRRVRLRSDWEDVKYELMKKVLYCKFSQHPELQSILLGTGDTYIEENTTGWHDNIWGNCNCDRCKHIKGQNLLGKALMEVREAIKLTNGETR